MQKHKQAPGLLSCPVCGGKVEFSPFYVDPHRLCTFCRNCGHEGKLGLREIEALKVHKENRRTDNMEDDKAQQSQGGDTMTKEEIYDNEIAPELYRLAERCMELGMPLFATVDFSTEEEEKLGSTISPNKNAGIEWKLISWAAASRGNVDALIGQIVNYAEEHGHSSAYLTILEKK